MTLRVDTRISATEESIAQLYVKVTAGLGVAVGTVGTIGAFLTAGAVNVADLIGEERLTSLSQLVAGT